MLSKLKLFIFAYKNKTSFKYKNTWMYENCSNDKEENEEIEKIP